METISCSRTGKRALRFKGDGLTSATTKTEHEPTRSRWWAVDVYGLGGGRLVVALNWRASWPREHDLSLAEVFPDAMTAALYLEGLDPLSELAGYPDGEQFAGRQHELEQALIAAWGGVVSRVLDELGVEVVLS